MTPRVLRILLTGALCGLLIVPGTAQVRLNDAADRSAFRSWFVFLADAQFYRTTPDVTDCAALVRHAFREALRAHTPEWVRRAELPFAPPLADVRRPPVATSGGWPLFHVGGDRYAEFADAATIIRLNSSRVSRDAASARPGDLLFFHQSGQRSPDHLMVFVGRSMFADPGDDWVVYHTGPDDSGDRPSGQAHPPAEGEVRKVRLSHLLAHPSPRWRPAPVNPSFAGVFRLTILW